MQKKNAFNSYSLTLMITFFALTHCAAERDIERIIAEEQNSKLTKILIEAPQDTGRYSVDLSLKKESDSNVKKEKNINGTVSFRNMKSCSVCAEIDLPSGKYSGQIEVINSDPYYFLYYVESKINIKFSDQNSFKKSKEPEAHCENISLNTFLCPSFDTQKGGLKVSLNLNGQNAFSYKNTFKVWSFPVLTFILTKFPMPLFGFAGFQRSFEIKVETLSE